MPNRHTLGQQKLARRRGTKMTAECSRRATRGVREPGWWLRGRQREAAGGDNRKNYQTAVLSSTNPSAPGGDYRKKYHVYVPLATRSPLAHHFLVPSHSTVLTQNLLATKRQEDDRAGRGWTRESRGRATRGRAEGVHGRAGSGSMIKTRDANMIDM
jgi:hypothetical protein